MSDWHDNEDAGDLEMMGAADYSGHLGELEAEEHARAFAAYGALWAKWKANDPTRYQGEITCESCDGPMNAENCVDGESAWHCGCDPGADSKPEPWNRGPEPMLDRG